MTGLRAGLARDASGRGLGDKHRALLDEATAADSLYQADISEVTVIGIVYDDRFRTIIANEVAFSIAGWA